MRFKTITHSARSKRYAIALSAPIALLAVVPAAALSVATAQDSAQLPLWGAIVLGLVEGFTEYLPVSSTGHLLVTSRLLGLADTEEAVTALDSYSIIIQIGAIGAVLVLYRQRIRQMLEGILGRDPQGRRVLIALIAAFIPTAIIGLSLDSFVQSRLFGVKPVAAAWLVGGAAILFLTRTGVMQRHGRDLTELATKHAVLIGAAQSLALWPGVSRSLVTIMAAVLVGLSLNAAVEFSFLLGLITLTAATGYTIVKDGTDVVAQLGLVNPLIGVVVGFAAAAISIKWMLNWLEQRGLDVFGYYRLGIGSLAFLALGMGWISS